MIFSYFWNQKVFLWFYIKEADYNGAWDNKNTEVDSKQIKWENKPKWLSLPSLYPKETFISGIALVAAGCFNNISFS